MDRNTKLAERAIPGALATATLLLPLITACGNSSNDGAGRTVALDFTDPEAGDAQGWEAGFADYGVEQEAIMEFDSGHMPLPGELSDHGYGLMVGATNRSDDVFMYWTGPITGLAPETAYSVRFEVEFATDSPSGCFGIGGAPGESVWVKTGMTLERPDREVMDDHWRMTIDKGNQATGGEDAIIVGDVGNEGSDCITRVWEFKTVENDDDTLFFLDTDASGTVWLTVGTDSGFEGRTEIFYTRLEVELVPR